jgi:hypothetical protein
VSVDVFVNDPPRNLVQLEKDNPTRHWPKVLRMFCKVGQNTRVCGDRCAACDSWDLVGSTVGNVLPLRRARSS